MSQGNIYELSAEELVRVLPSLPDGFKDYVIELDDEGEPELALITLIEQAPQCFTNDQLERISCAFQGQYGESTARRVIENARKQLLTNV